MITVTKHLPSIGELWRGNNAGEPATEIVSVDAISVRHKIDGKVVRRSKNGFLKNYSRISVGGEVSGIVNLEKNVQATTHSPIVLALILFAGAFFIGTGLGAVITMFLLKH